MRAERSFMCCGNTVESPRTTIVLGLGNPVLGDDGVGWHVAEECAKQIADAPHIEVDCVAVGGLSLMERLVGYDCAILIDAITTGQEPPGAVRCVRLDELANLTAGHTSSSHDTTLQTALNLGRRMGAHLPDSVIVVTVEAQRVNEFSEELSPAVAVAVPQAVQMVLQMLKEQSISQLVN